LKLLKPDNPLIPTFSGLQEQWFHLLLLKKMKQWIFLRICCHQKSSKTKRQHPKHHTLIKKVQ